MIIQIVQKVNSCMGCPNFRRTMATENIGEENYICLANCKKIGSSHSRSSARNLRNKVSDLCPFKNDEVNRRPIRGR